MTEEPETTAHRTSHRGLLRDGFKADMQSEAAAAKKESRVPAGS